VRTISQIFAGFMNEAKREEAPFQMKRMGVGIVCGRKKEPRTKKGLKMTLHVRRKEVLHLISRGKEGTGIFNAGTRASCSFPLLTAADEKKRGIVLHHQKRGGSRLLKEADDGRRV
jgi:hypothetical protein